MGRKKRPGMANETRWRESITAGFQVFPSSGGEEFGAVRDVCPGGRDEIVVYIENAGEQCIPLTAVVDVHDEKVMIDVKHLAPDVQSAVRHAHDSEAPGF
jgi:hypothetical protein